MLCGALISSQPVSETGKWPTVYSSCTGVTGLMKTVLRHRRQASIKTRSEHRRPVSTETKKSFTCSVRGLWWYYCIKLKPCRRAGMIWQSTKDLMLFSVPIARLPSTTEHSICSSTLEELCCKRYSNLGSWEVYLFVNPLKWWAERQFSHEQASRNIPWHCSKHNQIGLLFVVSDDSILHVTASTRQIVQYSVIIFTIHTHIC